MKNKGEIRNIIRTALNEDLQRSGGYSTEEMDKFIDELIHVFNFTPSDDVALYQLRNSVNVPSDRNATVMSITAQDLIANWSRSKEMFGQENPSWYIWNVETKDYGSSKSIEKHSDYKLDKDSVLEFIKNNPDEVKGIKIGFDSEPQEEFGKRLMARDYGSINEARREIRNIIKESTWTSQDWDNFLGKEKSGGDLNKESELKNSITQYIDSESF